jgi:hypothetical protein
MVQKIYARIDGETIELEPIKIIEVPQGGDHGAYKVVCKRKDNGKQVELTTGKIMLETEKDLEGKELSNYRRTTVNARGYMLDAIRRDVELGRYNQGEENG